MTQRELVQKALDMRQYSYAPYSNFRVGAALERGPSSVCPAGGGRGFGRLLLALRGLPPNASRVQHRSGGVGGQSGGGVYRPDSGGIAAPQLWAGNHGLIVPRRRGKVTGPFLWGWAVVQYH